MKGITLNEIRFLIHSIHNQFGLDLTNISISQFWVIVNDFMSRKHIRFPDILLNRMNENPDFFEEFKASLAVEETELFRDPELWKFLNTSIIPVLLNENEKVECLLPASSSGEDLYSLLILLEKNGWPERFNIETTVFSKFWINKIKAGNIIPEKLAQGTENFNSTFDSGDINDYLISINQKLFLDKKLLERIVINETDFYPNSDQKSRNLIIFRNKMLMYNNYLKSEVLALLCQSLQKGGYLIIGVKETIDPGPYGMVTLTSENGEKIFRKSNNG